MKRSRNIGFYFVTILLALHTAGLIAQTDTLCFNDTILYEIPGPESMVYDWTISGGSIIFASTNKDSMIVVWNESTGLHSLEVTQYTESSCQSEPERLEVFVYKPTVNLGGDREICEGSSDLLVLDSDFKEYFWNDQPGTNEFVINTEGSIKLEVKDKYGCWAGDSIAVIENKIPEPDFTLIVDTLNRSVLVFNLSDSSWHYFWDFGDGTYSEEYKPGVHTYSEPGTYKITLSASTITCTGADSKEVNIINSLQADFIAVFEGCAPAEITFINLSTYADTYYWDFGNGNSSTDEAPVTRYDEPGIYEVSLYAKKDAGTSISKKSIHVNKSPVAEFNISPTEINTYKEIDITNLSTDAVKYLWDFGDGETSTQYEPLHSYFSEGVYNISLSVWSETGCFDSLLIPDAIRVKQACRILFPDGFIPNKNGPGGGYYDPIQKVDNNEVFHPIYENLEDYELKIYNRWGELIFVSRNIDVGWDGYYKGKLAPQDTYVYIAKASCLTGEDLSSRGSVTLIY